MNCINFMNASSVGFSLDIAVITSVLFIMNPINLPYASCSLQQVFYLLFWQLGEINRCLLIFAWLGGRLGGRFGCWLGCWLSCWLSCWFGGWFGCRLGGRLGCRFGLRFGCWLGLIFGWFSDICCRVCWYDYINSGWDHMRKLQAHNHAEKAKENKTFGIHNLNKYLIQYLNRSTIYIKNINIPVIPFNQQFPTNLPKTATPCPHYQLLFGTYISYKKTPMFLIDRFEQPRGTPKKMDTMFYNSIKQTKQNYMKRLCLHTIKLLILIIFLVIDIKVLHSDHHKILTLIKLGIATCVVNLVVNLVIVQVGYQDGVGNNRFFLQLAQATHHVCPEQVILHQQDLRELENCVSPNIYNIATQARNNDPSLTEQIRQKYQVLYSKLIEGEVYQKHKSLPCLDILAKMLSLATFIYGIIALATDHPNIPELVVMIVYLFLEAWNIWTVLAIVLFIVFMPLMCCVGCVYFMCFGSNALIDRNSLSIPEPVDATARIIEQTEGSCSVCLQNFNLGEKLIVLGCSPLHTFHENCILSWLRVSNSCPMCRSPLPQSL